MKNIIVKINDAVQTVQEVAVVTNDGQPTVIKGVKNVNYQLVDQATGRGPDHIVTKRVGKDLHISLEDAGEETDLIIEGFYEDDRSALIGQAEDGQYYYYIPDTGEVADYVTQLQAGDVEGQALGGSPYATPWWIGATDTGFGYLPWILGLIGVGALAAALADDDDDKSSTPAKTATPTIDSITHVDEDGDGVADKTTITGTAEPGSTVTVTLPDGSTVTTTADSDGNYTVDVPKLADDTEIKVTAKADGKETSDPATATIDNTAPDAPAITTNPDGSVTVDPADDATETTITYVDENGDTKTVTFTKEDTDGEPDTWVDNNPNDTVTVDPTTGVVTIPADAVEDKSTVTATNKDEAGNESEPSTATTTADPGSITVDATDSNTGDNVLDTTAGDGNGITIDAITTDSYQANIPPWLIDESQKTDFITNDQTLVFSGTLTKELAADEKVQISLDGGTTWVDAVTTGTSWSYDNTTNTMAEGTYDVIARIVDTIGNVGPSATQEVVIDITPSNLTVTNVSIVADTSDDGILTADEVGTATTTDVTVTFTNAVEGDVIYLINNINDDPSTYMVHTLTAEEAAAGTYTFTGVDLPVGADSSLISLAQSGRDQAGNVSSSNQVTDKVRIPSTPTISLGANDDSLTAGDIIRGSTIDMGDGNDTVDFTAATFGQAAYTTSLSTGAGEDVIKLGTLTTSLTGSHSVDAGADNDTVVLTQDYTRESIGMTTYIQGGEGTDTLAITGDGTTVRISSGTYLGVNEGIVGFENFDMTVNSALEAETTAQTVSLTAADVLSLGVTDNTIYISGDANDTVDLGANGSTNTGSFTKTLTTTTQTALDGTEHTYTLYTHTNGAQVYIDNNIVNASGVI